MRRRIAGAGLTALVLAALTATLGASVAQAACPNEAFRTGPSALLAECRAYEQVSPVDKESGAGSTEKGAALVSTSGDAVLFHSRSAFGDSQGRFLYNPYIGTRAGGTWETQAVGGPQSSTNFTGFTADLATSPDLGLTAMVSREALAPGAIPGGSNVYIRDNRTGTYSLVRAIEGQDEIQGWLITDGGPFAAATPDWSTVLFNFGNGIFEYREGQLHLAVTGGVVPGTPRTMPNLMAADGSSFLYETESMVYRYRRGEEPLLVTEDGSGNPASISYPGHFVGGSPSGDLAFFVGNDGFLYRFRSSAAAGSRLTRISPPGPQGESPEVKTAILSEDGTTVYFASPALLTPDARPRPQGTGGDLYVWRGGADSDEGTLRYVGKTEDPDESFQAFPIASVSPDGRFLGLQAFGRLTPDAIGGQGTTCPSPGLYDPAGPCPNVFVYSYDANRLECASCDGAPVGKSRFGGAQRSGTAIPTPSVLDDGTVYFDTSNPLTARDVNGARDVYSWRDGQAQLISSGTGSYPASFIAASTDGSNVFFQTAQSLVGQDVDELTDLYDARIDGGLPQGGSPPPPSCVPGVDCRSGVVATSPSVPPATAGLEGKGNVAGACLALREKALAARSRSAALARRARRTQGDRARALQKRAAREAKAARRLGRRAGNCTGGGR